MQSSCLGFILNFYLEKTLARWTLKIMLKSLYTGPDISCKQLCLVILCETFVMKSVSYKYIFYLNFYKIFYLPNLPPQTPTPKA